MSPRTVDYVASAIGALCDAVGVPVPAPRTVPATPVTARAFVPIWRRPWMSLNRDTYGSSLLERIGVGNVFAEEPQRYPEVTIDDVVARAPDLVLLPDEPYRFTERHAREMRAALPGARVMVVDGRDLFWWGIRTADAAARLRAVL